MNRLIKLEFSRIRMGSQMVAFLIVNVCITLLTFMMSILTAYNGAGLNAVFSSDILIKAFFIVWEAILITQVIIEEFRSGTLLILYSYPINRKKLILAKLITVLGVIFVFAAISQIIQNLIFFILSRVVGSVYYHIDVITVIHLLTTTIGAVFCGLISFGVGMINRSIVATIISSVVIVSTTISTQGNSQHLMASRGISTGLGLIGLIVAFVTVKRIISKDLYV